MNCAGVRKFLYAFADGQLTVRANCQVLDHLKMCPDCSRIVDDHQAVRAAVQRILEQIQVSGALEDRVRRAIATGKRTTARRSLKLLFSVRTLAAAACVALAFVAGLKYAIPGPPTSGLDRAGIVRVRLGDDAVSKAVMKHDSCCQVAGAHHSAELPRSLSEVAAAIAGRHGNLFKVIAPDLSGHGFQFESANFCGVRDNKPCRDGLHVPAGPDGQTQLAGGHLIYAQGKCGTPTRLSVFSVPRWDRLDRCGGAAPAGAQLRRYVVEQGSGNEVSVAVWHEDATSFVCCGKIEPEAMTAIAEDVRVALNDPLARQVFAMLWSAGR